MGLNPSRFHYLLSQIPHFRTIITTNYDTLIEDAYKCDYLQVIVNDKDFNCYDTNTVHLFKIHGDINHLDKIIASKSDYRHAQGKNNDILVWNKAISELSTKCTIFVGYGLEDDNVLGQLEDIISRIGNDHKKIFVVIPNATALKRQEIKHLGALYIDSTAEDFLANVIDGLKDTFGYDRKHNICSLDTSSRFGLLNGVSFSFENIGHSTNITNIKGVSAPASHNLNFRTNNRHLIDRQFTGEKVNLVKGFSLPSYTLSTDELKSFEYRVNGLKISDIADTKSVIICPGIDDVNLTFKSTSSGICKKITAKKYYANDEIHICIDSDFCRIEFVFKVPNKDGESLKMVCHFTLNEEFHDLDEALSWSNLMVAMFQRSDLRLYINDICFGPCVLNDFDGRSVFDDILSYCDNIKCIENHSDAIFTAYERFSPHGYFVSKVIRSYLTKTEFTDIPREELKRINIDLYEEVNYSETNDYVARFRTSINEPLLFCGRKFAIPEERILMTKCKIVSITPTEEGLYHVIVYPTTEKIQYGYYDSNYLDITDSNDNSEVLIGK